MKHTHALRKIGVALVTTLYNQKLANCLACVADSTSITLNWLGFFLLSLCDLAPCGFPNWLRLLTKANQLLHKHLRATTCLNSGHNDQLLEEMNGHQCPLYGFCLMVDCYFTSTALITGSVQLDLSQYTGARSSEQRPTRALQCTYTAHYCRGAGKHSRRFKRS